MSDGWDDIERNHLINFLIGSAKGVFFDGTIMLSSNDHEDAKAVAKHICDAIEKQGALSVVQVVTDTCSVMKSAWKIIEDHVHFLRPARAQPRAQRPGQNHGDRKRHRKDNCKEPKTQKVLNRFWGRTRWARTKLREVAAKNHGRKVGLYRAKATRFAGKVREMGRVLRLKADLQEVAISTAYGLRPAKVEEAEEGRRSRGGRRRGRS
eukprot:2906699-Prymnesium_polylepis.1